MPASHDLVGFDRGIPDGLYDLSQGMRHSESHSKRGVETEQVLNGHIQGRTTFDKGTLYGLPPQANKYVDKPQESCTVDRLSRRLLEDGRSYKYERRVRQDLLLPVCNCNPATACN